MNYPVVAAAIVAVLVLFAAWLLPKPLRFVRRFLRALFGAEPPSRARATSQCGMILMMLRRVLLAKRGDRPATDREPHSAGRAVPDLAAR